MSGFKYKMKPPIYVYLITDDNCHCKVGIAANPEVRIKELQTGNPLKLRIVRKWGFSSFDNAFLCEQLVLSASLNSMAHGEWLKAKSAPLSRLITSIHTKITNSTPIIFHRQFNAWKQLSRHNMRSAA